jgi:hypothetical protein
LLLAGAASGQAPPAPEWRPVAPVTPQVLPAAFQKVDTVPPKPAAPQPFPPQPTPIEKLQPEPVEPGRIVVPAGMRTKASEDEGEFQIRTDKPGLDWFTHRFSEEQMFQDWRDAARKRPGAGRIYFPEEEPVSNQVYTARQSPRLVRLVEPSYVTHGRLFFEQPNQERYGWDLGPLSPAIEMGLYYYDLVMLPYHVGSQTCHQCDGSAGKCLPGDATPLLFYREQFSLTGIVFEAGAVLGLNFAFP